MSILDPNSHMPKSDIAEPLHTFSVSCQALQTWIFTDRPDMALESARDIQGHISRLIDQLEKAV